MYRILLIIALCALPLHALAQEPAAVPKAQPQLSLLPALQPPAATTTPRPPAAKLGLVDINRISSEAEMGKKAQALLKEQQAKLQKQIDAKRKQLDRAKAEIERQLPSLAPPQREAKAREFQKKVEEFQKFGAQAEKGLQENQEKLTKALLSAIEKAAGDYAAANGLAAVVVRRELLYLAGGIEALDISEALVGILNDAAKKDNKTAPRK